MACADADIQGRLIIILCIPVLFISPLLAIFATNRDVVVYLTVLYVFVTLMLIGVRYIGSRWATWHQKLTLVEDSELRVWYLDRGDSEFRDELQEKTDPALLKLARQCLLHEVLQETKKPFFAQSTRDALVLRLTRSFDATAFLMVIQPLAEHFNADTCNIGLVLSLLWCSEANDI